MDDASRPPQLAVFTSLSLDGALRSSGSLLTSRLEMGIVFQTLVGIAPNLVSGYLMLLYHNRRKGGIWEPTQTASPGIPRLK